MNHLAHIYLSFENDNLIIGNFIADFIKGNKYKHLPLDIQKGILIHRQIDSFTDTHKIVRKSKRRLHEQYGHYDGIIIDILYDHFLAKNWKHYSNISLLETEINFINVMKQNVEFLPEKVKKILPYIEKQKWLSNYTTYKGIENALISVKKRTKFETQIHLAVSDLKEHYSELENDFTLFFKELIIFASQKIKE